MERAVAICHTQIRKTVKTFDVQVQQDMPEMVSDPDAIEQTLINLLINAAQAADKPDSHIRLKVWRGTSGKEGLVLEVEDNGCGMDAKTASRVFDPFFTTKEEGMGTGLGLYISKNLLESVGGSISVESESGRGATFRVVIPDLGDPDQRATIIRTKGSWRMNDVVLVIDDEMDFLDSAKRGLISAGIRDVRVESDARIAASSVQQGDRYAVALIDITMPWINGVQLLEIIKSVSPDTECIMVTAINDARTAVECLQKGAYDYLTKPVSRDELVSKINRAMERRRLLEVLSLGKTGSLPQIKHKDAFAPIVTRSEKMLRLLKEAELHAASNVPALITGESGTGKELLARAIHRSSPRASFPFTSINMASLTGSLFDAEFFGHTKGAFTGAEKDRAGYLEHSNRGTLFLDEIGDLPLDFQGKLLRVLQEGEIIKLGTSSARKVDVRFIAATNADLDKLLSKGQFRKDLYYRLQGAWLRILPLRERREDIPLLINTFLREFRGEEDRQIEEDALQILMNYDYPGNVRELRSIIQSSCNLAQHRPIMARYLPEYLRGAKPARRQFSVPAGGPIVPLAEAERGHIIKAYEETAHNKLRTAKLLGIGLNTLRRKLASYGVD